MTNRNELTDLIADNELDEVQSILGNQLVDLGNREPASESQGRNPGRLLTYARAAPIS